MQKFWQAILRRYVWNWIKGTSKKYYCSLPITFFIIPIPRTLIFPILFAKLEICLRLSELRRRYMREYLIYPDVGYISFKTWRRVFGMLQMRTSPRGKKILRDSLLKTSRETWYRGVRRLIIKLQAFATTQNRSYS